MASKHKTRKLKLGENWKYSENGSSDSLADWNDLLIGGDRTRGPGRGGNQNVQFNTPKVHPLGLKRLEEILLLEPTEIILSLAEPTSGLKECLAKPIISTEDLRLLLKILSRGFSNSQLHPRSENLVMAILTSSNLFNSHVTQLLFNRKLQNQKAVLSDLTVIFEAIITKMPISGPEHLAGCVSQCAMLAKDQGGGEVLDRLEKIKTEIEVLQENNDKQLREKRRNNLENWDDDDEPPEDFRDIYITPSVEEIRFTGKTFLRKNVIEGKFKDVDHYLDVHFRLLREDFVAPLRTGIRDYLRRDMTSSVKKILDIRLYKRVIITEPQYSKHGVLYTVQFDSTKFRNVNWDISRRLIFGSLVCLSNNNFETAMFGTVADRNLDELKVGKIKIKIEDEFQQKREFITSELRKIYDMIESQAYFEAYRHVLKGLQRTNVDNMPLQQYIIHVQQHLQPPAYLDCKTVYTFTKIAEISDRLSKKDVQIDGCVLDISKWPSSQELGLDESQRRAMHLALSSALAVIQGPPGTGKTHVGLKIMQTLLANRSIWKTEKNSSPILVVCLTNHALDQFLEGILSFTNRVVRIGGRSKNENLEKYNLHYIQNDVRVLHRNMRRQFRHFQQRMQNTRYRKRYRHQYDDEDSILQELQYDQSYDGGEPPENLRYIEGETRVRQRFIKEEFETGNQLWTEADERNAEDARTDFRDIRRKLDTQKNFLEQLTGFILRENALEELTGDDARLKNSLLSGFEERFEVDPFDKKWCPKSFLAVWLGLTPFEFVSDFELDEFYHQDTTKFRVKGRRHEQQPLSKLFRNIDDSKNLIDVEDQWTVINRNRQTENEKFEIAVATQVDDMIRRLSSVDINQLNDPRYFSYGMRMDETTINSFRERGTIRRAIAKRELSKQDVTRDCEIAEVKNVWFLPLADRWRLYRRWVGIFRASYEEKMKIDREEYEKLAKQCQELTNAEELKILRHNDVIGMTTTGAAKYLTTLQELGPKIVIVEEAAEVLESHIITSLSHKTQHLILIGDHQQLRPNVEVYELAKKYHLDVSLFERLIKNKVQYETLQLQHRMRPEISRLLIPNIYKNLEDHPSVRKYPPIKGIKSSVFFLTHTQPEESTEDSTSSSNPFEAEFLVGLCRYLLQQGYEPSQITILTTYAGQLFVLRRLMTSDVFKGVKLTVVDNYQGEENDIILLSFVRSNDDGKIGFLKIDNRVNVALSRAKHGMFCVGNFKFLASRSDLWRAIVNDLNTENQIGNKMPLACQKHNHESLVTCLNDFQKLAPDGGCFRPCVKKLSCGHICKRFCHGTKHEKCEEPVEKNHLFCDHKIILPCYTDMTTVLCEVKVERVLPKCRHVVEIDCHLDVDEYLCVVKVERKLPRCTHVAEMECYENPDKIHCKAPCEIRLDKCDHLCSRPCHPLDIDFYHKLNKCLEKCSKKICERDHPCENRCFEPCSTCVVLVDKELPCGHVIKHPCSEPIVLEYFDESEDEFPIKHLLDCSLHVNESSKQCSELCKSLLPRSQQCRQKCRQSLAPCKVIVEKTVKAMNFEWKYSEPDADQKIYVESDLSRIRSSK